MAKTTKRNRDRVVDKKAERKARLMKSPKNLLRAVDECVGMTTFEPTKWQKEALDVIHEHDITFVDSVAGVGKTSVALYYACQRYLSDVTMRIVFVRTPAEVGKDRIGFLPGSASTGVDDKLGPHFESTKLILSEFIGKNKMDSDENKRIFFQIPNFSLGRTYNNCTYIIDEAQLLEPLILKLLLERIGEGTKCIVLGASGQLYTENNHGRAALKDALERFFDEDMEKKYNRIGYYKFPLEAVQRADVVKDVITAYGNE